MSNMRRRRIKADQWRALIQRFRLGIARNINRSPVLVYPLAMRAGRLHDRQSLT